MLKVKIEIEDEHGKSAKIEIDESDKLTNLIIIEQVFKLFGIGTDVMQMADTYNKVGKAYTSFFDEVDPIETKPEVDVKLKQSEIRDGMIKGLTTNKDELETTYKEINDQPEFMITGIKTDDDGTKRYRLRYQCTSCTHTGNHYVYMTSNLTWCHRCQFEMKVFPAHPDGFPFRDGFGNYFRAGEYRDRKLFTN